MSSWMEDGAVSLKSMTRVSFLRMLCTNITPPLKNNTERRLWLFECIQPNARTFLNAPFGHLTLRYQKCVGARFPSREQQRWLHPRWIPVLPGPQSQEMYTEPHLSPRHLGWRPWAKGVNEWEKKGRRCYSSFHNLLDSFDRGTIQAANSRGRAYLWVSKVDLHDESHSNPCGKGEAGCDDDCQPISLAGAALCEGVFSRLMQRSQVVAGQVRSWGWETLKARWLQKQIWV